MILDYVVFETDGEWQVWTPDRTGACIGSGATRIAALRNAYGSLTGTAICILDEALTEMEA